MRSGKYPTLTVHALWRAAGSVMALLKTAQGAVPVLLCSEVKFDLGELDSLRRGWQKVDGVEFRAWPKGKRLSAFQCPTPVEVVDETLKMLGGPPEVPRPVRTAVGDIRIVVIKPTAPASKKKRPAVAPKSARSSRSMKPDSDAVRSTLRANGLTSIEIERVITAGRLLVKGLKQVEAAHLVDVLNRPQRRGEESNIGFVLGELLSKKR